MEEKTINLAAYTLSNIKLINLEVY